MQAIQMDEYPFQYIMESQHYLLTNTYRENGRFMKSINDAVTNMKHRVFLKDLSLLINKLTIGATRSILSYRLINDRNIIDLLVTAFGTIMNKKMIDQIIKTIQQRALVPSEWITCLKNQGYQFDERQIKDLNLIGYTIFELTGRLSYYDIFIPAIRKGNYHHIFNNDIDQKNDYYLSFVSEIKDALENKLFELPTNILINTINYLPPLVNANALTCVKYISGLHDFINMISGNITNTFDELIDQIIKIIKCECDYAEIMTFEYSKKIASYYKDINLDKYMDNRLIMSLFMFPDIQDYNPQNDLLYLYEAHGPIFIDQIKGRGYFNNLSVINIALINSLHITKQSDLDSILCKRINFDHIDRFVDNYTIFSNDFHELCEYKYILTDKYVDLIIHVISLTNINRTINYTSYSRMIQQLYNQSVVVSSAYNPDDFSIYIYQSLSKRDQDILSRISIYEWALVKTVLRYDLTITKELLLALLLNNQLINVIRLMCSHPKYDPIIQLFDPSIVECVLQMNERRWIRKNILEKKPQSLAHNIYDLMAYDQKMVVENVVDPRYHQIIKNTPVFCYEDDVKKKNDMIIKSIRKE